MKTIDPNENDLIRRLNCVIAKVNELVEDYNERKGCDAKPTGKEPKKLLWERIRKAWNDELDKVSWHCRDASNYDSAYQAEAREALCAVEEMWKKWRTEKYKNLGTIHDFIDYLKHELLGE